MKQRGWQVLGLGKRVDCIVPAAPVVPVHLLYRLRLADQHDCCLHTGHNTFVSCTLAVSITESIRSQHSLFLHALLQPRIIVLAMAAS